MLSIVNMRVSVLVGTLGLHHSVTLIGDGEGGGATVATMETGREGCSKQGGRFTFPLLGAKMAFWTVHVAMVIALLGLVTTAMARQPMDLWAMWFAGGVVSQISEWRDVEKSVLGPYEG